MSQQPKSTVLAGGLDLVSAKMTIKPGRLTDALNYEAVMNGYRRMDGYERFDGRTKPSQASYWVLTYTGGYAFADDSILTGAVSGATGRVLPGVAEPAGTVVLTDVTGTFLPAENILVASVVRGVTASGAINRGAPDDTTDLAWYRIAVANARSRIAAVPGLGPVRGTWIYNGVRYAFRNAPDNLSCQMWASSAAGWVLQSLGRILFFTGGSVAEIPEGSVITGSTSGATATVKRVVSQSGSYFSSLAVGYLMLSGQTGTFVAETIKVSGVVRATIAGNSAPVTIAPGGRYRFTNYNFYGASNLKRMYGVSGVDRAFEWDGTTYTPIYTGMPVDTPKQIAAHKKHLFLGFPGGSLQNSSIGKPLLFSAVLGAAEIGLGDDITALLPEYVDTLIVFGRTQTFALYGSSVTDFALKPISVDAGAQEWTAQTIGAPHYLDEAGLRSMATTTNYGNFDIGTLSDAIKPLIVAKTAANVRPILSMKVRGKAQYRLFYDDGTGFTVYLAKKYPEFIPFDLGGLVPTCGCAAEDVAGDETLLIGSSSGMVYEIDAGVSMDGASLDSYLTLAAENMGAPTVNKVFSHVEFQLETERLTDIGVVPSFTTPYDDTPTAPLISLSLFGQAGGYWNQATWNDFYWSAESAGLAFSDIEGIGRDVALTVLCSSTEQRPHILKAVTYNFSKRGLAK